MEYANPKLILGSEIIEPTKIAWRSPSNIALIKYWGKYGRQLPKNPSISFTLDAAFTETEIEYQSKAPGTAQGIDIDFFFEGQKNDAFQQKIEKFFHSILDVFPFLGQLKMTIRSSNSFPHSAGIASSASAMSALAMCLCSIEHQLFNPFESDEAFLRKGSYVARLGSGSACRSIFGGLAVWGETGEVKGASNYYAVPVANQVHEIFHDFHDDILLISKEEKEVSSRAGHGLMDENPYAKLRYEQAGRRLHHLMQAMKMGDLERFGSIVENEALTLHALMMTSNPSYILMKPNTLHAIEKLRRFRKETGHPVYFTLDAGPNLHLLYPHASVDAVQTFIKSELASLCEKEHWIADQVGQGAREI